MHPLRLSVASYLLDQPLLPALRSTALMGVRGVQFDTRSQLLPDQLSDSGRKQLLHHLDELGLQTASVHVPTRRTLYDEEQLDLRLAGFRRFMEFAYHLGARVLTARIGRIPAEADSKEYLLLRQVLADLARHGNHVGVTFSIIPSGDSPATLKTLLEAVTEGLIGIDLDPAGCAMSGQDPVEAIRQLHPWLMHAQARDGLRDVDGSGVETTLGRGEVDWQEFLALLQEIRYAGWINVIRTQGEDRIGDMTRAVQYLQEVVFS